MLNLEEFLAHTKSMIIAPAGYGKTHTIVECVKLCKDSKKCLILTHTHAGIASIREKMKTERVEPSKYSLETISSFALHYTDVFHIDKNSIPNVEDGSTHFNFAVETTTKILQAKPIKEAIKSAYSHLIVDEYQDCTQRQHRLILALSNILPTHILGDPLQGIFEFRGDSLVNMESDDDMTGFKQNKQELYIPWRWNNAGTIELVQFLSSVRSAIKRGDPIHLEDLQNHESLEIKIIHPQEYFQKNSDYHRILYREISNKHINSLLLIHPISENQAPRLKVIQQFPSIRLVEAIDDKDFYKYPKLFDEKQGDELIDAILLLMKNITLKTVIDNWFRADNSLKNKKNDKDKIITNYLQRSIDLVVQNKTPLNIVGLIENIQKLHENRCYRYELLQAIIKSLRSSSTPNESIYELMKKNRDFVRRQGRRIIGKCIGTTLLTKGLEFDTVIVLDAHLFKKPKHLYVALTRACKKLIVITQDPILNPYPPKSGTVKHYSLFSLYHFHQFAVQP